jgi:hypothetical protein
MDIHPSGPFKLAAFLVGQRDNNPITNATNELKGVLILSGDCVNVMPPRGNYVDRVVASPVYRHTVVVTFFSKDALDSLFVNSIRIHQIARRFAAFE